MTKTQKIAFLKVKAFIPTNRDDETKIGPFSTGDVIFLKGKFIACPNYYLVTATSIKPLDFDYDSMPIIGLNVTIVGITSQTVKNINGTSVLEFYVEEKIGEREPHDYWLEVRHNPNNIYLSKKNHLHQPKTKIDHRYPNRSNYLRTTNIRTTKKSLPENTSYN